MNAICNAVFAEDIFDVIPSKMNPVHFRMVGTIIVVALLETTNYNVTEISNLVGYENPLYFSRFFRKQFGASPSQFRKQLRQNEENQMTEPEKK